MSKAMSVTGTELLWRMKGQVIISQRGQEE